MTNELITIEIEVIQPKMARANEQEQYKVAKMRWSEVIDMEKTKQR